MQDNKYIRDSNTGILVSNDFAGLRAYKAQKQKNLQLAKVEEDINSLKYELSEIKKALNDFITINSNRG